MSGTHFILTADGSVFPNPGLGGWAARIRVAGTRTPPLDISGAEGGPTTNNDMELRGVVEGLRRIVVGDLGPKPWTLLIRTDSQLVLKCATFQWGRKAPNLLPWFRKYDDLKDHFAEVRWHWVKGHSGDEDNERCDHLAGRARERLTLRADRRTTCSTLSLKRLILVVNGRA